MESTYDCLGITCAHVGGLWLGGETFYHPGAEPCVDEGTGAKAETDKDSEAKAPIAGYDPGSNVEDHNALDLDQKDLEAYLGEKPPNYAAAKKIYTKGGHSGCKAVFTVPALASALAKGDTVTQAGNEKAIGYVKDAADAGATKLTVAYTSICKSPDSGVKTPDPAGCFTAHGELTTLASG